MIIAEKGYQDHEYGDSKMVLEAHGHIVDTASTSFNVEGRFSGKTEVDLLIEDAQVDDYNAIVFIGGAGSYKLFDNKICHKLAKDFYNKNKLTCAICAAPSILANAEILQNKRTTCFADQAENLKLHGANYTGNPVEKDGIIITANGPDATTEFAELIANCLEQ